MYKKTSTNYTGCKYLRFGSEYQKFQNIFDKISSKYTFGSLHIYMLSKLLEILLKCTLTNEMRK